MKTILALTIGLLISSTAFSKVTCYNFHSPERELNKLTVTLSETTSFKGCADKIFVNEEYVAPLFKVIKKDGEVLCGYNFLQSLLICE